MKSPDFSAFHRIKADELWHYYLGSSLAIHMIDKKGQLTTKRLGCHFSDGDFPQLLVPKNTWFAATPLSETGYTLTGCTTAPGFEFDDFQMADRKTLCDLYPAHEALITKLTR